MSSDQDSKAEVKASENKQEDNKQSESEQAMNEDNPHGFKCCICGDDNGNNIDWKTLTDGRLFYFCFQHLSDYNNGNITTSDIQGSDINGNS